MNGGSFCQWDDATYDRRSVGSLQVYGNSTGLSCHGGGLTMKNRLLSVSWIALLLMQNLYLDADEPLPNTIRFGMAIGVTATYKNTSYYGNGLLENYSDRKRSAEVGEFSIKTDGISYNHAMPQENRNRTDTRWVKLSTLNNKSGLFIIEKPQSSFSVWPYSAKELFRNNLTFCACSFAL
ncbi:MAG: hypothetical protein L3J11_10655 [Draconibacterium sp.]|nr:hypothetical protein [Draconibacterium sp.]